jgi:fructose-bisphosphate aldolase class I
MAAPDLEAVARAVVTRGVLAADESIATLGKRFSSHGIANTEALRRDYRELLFSTPGLGEHISGAILFDETLRQSTSEGRRLVDLLRAGGVLPGIKVDRGTQPLAGHPGELITEGLDGLRARLDEYRELGAVFAKWRAVIDIGPRLPSAAAIEANAHALARYAASCQEAGIVPIVEPEVLMDGDHTLERCAEVTELTLRTVFRALADQRVVLEHLVLKPNMVVPGKKCPVRATSAQVAELTLRCLRRTVPAAVPGIAFLSGGQSELEATENLNAMNTSGLGRPWEVTFSYGRALQEGALAAWRGRAEAVPTAQRAFAQRARCNAAARRGTWTRELETA